MNLKPPFLLLYICHFALAQLESQTAHLTSLKSNPEMLLSKADVLAIDTSYNNVKKIWIARRKAGHTGLAMLADAKGLGKMEQKEFFEDELGIEFDSPELEELLKTPSTTSVLGKRKAL